MRVFLFFSLCCWIFDFGEAMRCTRGVIITTASLGRIVGELSEVECDANITHCVRAEAAGRFFERFGMLMS